MDTFVIRRPRSSHLFPAQTFAHGTTSEWREEVGSRIGPPPIHIRFTSASVSGAPVDPKAGKGLLAWKSTRTRLVTTKQKLEN